ncbi:MAG: hypothetical protein EOP54_22765 [Sphingobacteriales bacterium]|nr:MAG: hypothetical protein EOP54_22765 [Sphingobacteriales bacterium]
MIISKERALDLKLKRIAHKLLLLKHTLYVDDIEEGVHLLRHLRKHCELCRTYKTPMWRKGWSCIILGKRITLCNACGLRYKTQLL